MFRINEGGLDRTFRIVLGLLLIFAGYVSGGKWEIVLYVVALVPLLTGLAGGCPLYSLFHMDTYGLRKAYRGIRRIGERKLLSALPLQNFGDDAVEFGHIEGFGEVIAETRRQTPLDIARHGIGTDGDNWDILRFRFVL